MARGESGIQRGQGAVPRRKSVFNLRRCRNVRCPYNVCADCGDRIHADSRNIRASISAARRRGQPEDIRVFCPIIKQCKYPKSGEIAEAAECAVLLRGAGTIRVSYARTGVRAGIVEVYGVAPAPPDDTVLNRVIRETWRRRTEHRTAARKSQVRRGCRTTRRNIRLETLVVPH